MLHAVQFGLYCVKCLGVCMRASSEITLKCMVKQVGSVPSSAIKSILESMFRSVNDDVPRGLPGSILRVYKRVS